MALRRVDIVVPRDRILRWHTQLREHLARLLPEAVVFLRPEPRGDKWPDGVATLLRLERLLSPRIRQPLSETVEPTSTSLAPAGAPDEIIDLIGGATPTSETRVIRPLYDGHASDAAAVSALLNRRAPALTIADVGQRNCAARGVVSLEVADNLTSGLEAVYSRMAALIQRALLAPERSNLDAPLNSSMPSPVAFATRSLAQRCVREIYLLCCHPGHWRVGWRFIDGPGVFDRAALGGGAWRVMQDQNLSFSADPFPYEWRGRRGVFFELIDYRVNKGAIFYQPFDEAGPVGEPVLALEEPWHLSYPFLMEHGDELYMLPEASKSNSLTLYRCIEFPGKWEPVARLLEGLEIADATIFQHDGRYWMTSVVREGVGGYSDIMALHYADALFGPWRAHAQYPAIVDARFARPAGWVVRRNGVLTRPAQDCSQRYGGALNLMRIDKLTPDEFEQTPIAHIESGKGWPGNRLHTINRFGRLECIDGVVRTPKNLILRKIAHGLIDNVGLSAGVSPSAFEPVLQKS